MLSYSTQLIFPSWHNTNCALISRTVCCLFLSYIKWVPLGASSSLPWMPSAWGYQAIIRKTSTWNIVGNIFRCLFVVLFMVFNATSNNISLILWRSVLLVEETEDSEKTTDLSHVTDKLGDCHAPFRFWKIVGTTKGYFCSYPTLHIFPVAAKSRCLFIFTIY